MNANFVNGIYSVNHDLQINGTLRAESSINLNSPTSPSGWDIELTSNNSLNISNSSSSFITLTNNQNFSGIAQVGILGHDPTNAAEIQAYGSISMITSSPQFFIGTVKNRGVFQQYANGSGALITVADYTGITSLEPLNLQGFSCFSPNNKCLGVGDVFSSTGLPSANVHITGNQLTPRIILGGTEFFTGTNTSTHGIALLTGVNRTNNRQLWVGDSANLTQNTTNSIIRIIPGGGDISCLKTDGLTLSHLHLNNTIWCATTGNIGIGTTSPISALTINRGTTITDVIPSTGGGFSTAFNFLHTGSPHTYGLVGGVLSSSGLSWLQSRYTTTTGNLDMSLQPLGGNVGIGTTTPTTTLDVQGNINATSITAGSSIISQLFSSNVASKSHGTNITAGSITSSDLGLTGSSGVYIYSFARSDKNTAWNLVGILTWNGSSFTNNTTLAANTMSFTSISGTSFNYNPATALSPDTYIMRVIRLHGV